jgi:hypothetical protein
MSGTNVSPGYASSVTNSLLPPPSNPPRSIPFILNFGTITTLGIDLTNQIEQNYISGIQGMFIDNSTSSTRTTVYIPSSQQTLRVPAYSQAYLPIIAPTPPQLNVTNLGSATVGLQLFNYPTPACVWQPGTA